jgi:predicted RNA binding protein YcfA (HicA-like mRNA interferase family)
LEDGGSDLPKTVNQREAQKLLERHGWTRTKGSKHNVKMEKAGERPITLPKHRGQQYSKSLTRAILKQAGIV